MTLISAPKEFELFQLVVYWTDLGQFRLIGTPNIWDLESIENRRHVLGPSMLLPNHLRFISDPVHRHW